MPLVYIRYVLIEASNLKFEVMAISAATVYVGM